MNHPSTMSHCRRLNLLARGSSVILAIRFHQGYRSDSDRPEKNVKQRRDTIEVGESIERRENILAPLDTLVAFSERQASTFKGIQHINCITMESEVRHVRGSPNRDVLRPLRSHHARDNRYLYRPR